MAGRLFSMRTITEAMEKQKTDSVAISKPNAGIRSGKVRFAPFCCLCLPLSSEECDEANEMCTLASDSPARAISGVDYTETVKGQSR